MDTFEKIINNCDVLESIFKYLDLNEQLNISQICQEFETTITQLIWRFKCKNLKFTQIFPESVMVKCNDSDFESAMDYGRIEMFLSLCRNYVQNFVLSFVEFSIERIVFDFRNLTTITFHKCQVNNEILRQLAKNCLKLNGFHMECCKNRQQQPVILGRDIEVKIFQEIPELSELTVINLYNIDMDYEILQEFYKISKLKTLCVKGPLYMDNVSSYNDISTKSLENLTIGRFCNQKLWQQFSLKSLIHFKNLTTLIIQMDPFADLTVDDIFFLTLANNCQLLENLTLEHCKLCIQKLTSMKNLLDLNLNWCRGLSGGNLSDIFNVYNLKTLKLTNNVFQKNIYDYSYSSDHLSALTVGTTLQPDIVAALTNPFNSFKNITKLFWFQTGHSSLEKPNILENIPYIYPNVQELLLIDYYVKIEDLKRLKFLTTLKIHLSTFMLWSHLKHLLQLQYLKKLFINLSSGISIDDIEETNSCQDLTRNLEYLKISLVVFSANIDFWLLFLRRNIKLKLTVYSDCREQLFRILFFEQLLGSNKFPQQLQHINICDFNVDCKKLKADLRNTLSNYDFKQNEEGEYYIMLENS